MEELLLTIVQSYDRGLLVFICLFMLVFVGIFIAAVSEQLFGFLKEREKRKALELQNQIQGSDNQVSQSLLEKPAG